MRMYAKVWSVTVALFFVVAGCSDDPEPPDVRLPNTCSEHCSTSECADGSICNVAADSTRGFCRPISEVESCQMNMMDPDMSSDAGGGDLGVDAEMDMEMMPPDQDMGEVFEEGILHGNWQLSLAETGDPLVKFYLVHNAQTNALEGTFELPLGTTGDLGVTMWNDEVFSTSWEFESEDETEEVGQFTQAEWQQEDILLGRYRDSIDDRVRDALMTRLQ